MRRGRSRRPPSRPRQPPQHHWATDRWQFGSVQPGTPLRGLDPARRRVQTQSASGGLRRRAGQPAKSSDHRRQRPRHRYPGHMARRGRQSRRSSGNGTPEAESAHVRRRADGKPHGCGRRINLFPESELRMSASTESSMSAKTTVLRANGHIPNTDPAKRTRIPPSTTTPTTTARTKTIFAIPITFQAATGTAIATERPKKSGHDQAL